MEQAEQREGGFTARVGSGRWGDDDLAVGLEGATRSAVEVFIVPGGVR